MQRCCHTPTMPKQFLSIRLLPSHQFLRKLLKILRRHIQSSTNFPSHLLIYTSIKHHYFECDCGAAVIHRHCQTIPHYQAIFHINFAEIARELAQIHLIKHEPSLTPPKTYINQTLPLRMRLQHRCHPPTMPNNLSPSGYCIHF